MLFDVPRYRTSAIVLDVFGTLIQPALMRSAAYARLAKASNRPKFRGEVLRQNISIEALAEELGLGHMIPALTWDLNAELSQLRLYDGVADLIHHIKQKGFKVAICSNLAHAYGETVRALLAGADAYVFSYEVGHAKPEPQIYQAVCDALSCDPKTCLFIGNSPRADVEGPVQFGMRAVLASWPKTTPTKVLTQIGLISSPMAPTA